MTPVALRGRGTTSTYNCFPATGLYFKSKVLASVGRGSTETTRLQHRSSMFGDTHAKGGGGDLATSMATWLSSSLRNENGKLKIFVKGKRRLTWTLHWRTLVYAHTRANLFLVQPFSFQLRTSISTCANLFLVQPFSLQLCMRISPAFIVLSCSCLRGHKILTHPPTPVSPIVLASMQYNIYCRGMFTVRTSHFSLHHSQLIRCLKRSAFCRTQRIGILPLSKDRHSAALKRSAFCRTRSAFYCTQRSAFCRTQKISILPHWKIGFHRTLSVLTIPPTTPIMAGQPPTWLCAPCHCPQYVSLVCCWREG